MADKILFVVTNHDQMGDTGKKTGWFLPEVTHPYHVLQEAGYDIDFVSPEGGNASVDPGSLENADEISQAFLASDTYQQLENTLSPDEITHESYQAIFYAGGHGAMWDFADSETLASIATNIYEQGGVVSAVCHGPAGLVNIKLSNGEYLVSGKRFACFTNSEEAAVEATDIMPFLLESKLIERGGEHQSAADWAENTVVDERLVTGQNPASAQGVGEAIRNLLQSS